MSDAEGTRPERRLSDERLRLIFDISPVGILLVDASGTITACNARLADMLGHPAEDIAGTTYADHLHPANVDLALEQMQKLVTGEIRQVAVERCFRRKDGSAFWGQLNGRRHEAPDGTLVSLVASVTDISELKAAQASLLETEMRFRTLVESSLDVIFVLDRRGVFRFVSPSWGQHYGYPPEEVLGKDFRPFVHPDDAPTCARYLQEVMTTGRGGLSPSYRVRHADGSWRLFLANGRPFLDAQGNLLYVGVGRDITVQHELELERERLIADLRRALEDVKTLKGILPICACCKKIRDDHGYWTQVENYLTDHTDAEFSHGLCPQCIATLYPDLPSNLPPGKA